MAPVEYSRRIQKIVDHVRESRGVATDRRDRAFRLRRQWLRLENPRPAEDCTQRRPHFMRDHCEELVFQMARRLGLLGQRLCAHCRDHQMLVGLAHPG
jgi:hypothetical protein